MKRILSTLALPTILLASPAAHALKVEAGPNAAEVSAFPFSDFGNRADEPFERLQRRYDVIERRSIVVPTGPFSHRLARWLIDRAVRDRGGDIFIRVAEREEESYTEVVDGVTYPATNLVVDILIIRYR